MVKKSLLLFIIIIMLYAQSMYSQGTVTLINFTTASISGLPSVVSETSLRQVAVYLPDGYNAADTITRYPVLYALHRFFGTPGDLAAYYQPILDELIENKEIEPMIVVMPDGTYYPYINGMYTTASVHFSVGNVLMNWEKYIAVELPAFIDSSFNTKTEKQFRGISGFEVGGYGAVRLGMLHGSASPSSGTYQSFSALSGAGLDSQIFLDQIFNMFKYYFILESVPTTNPSIITLPPMALASVESKFIASPFNNQYLLYNGDRPNDITGFPLFIMFAASVAWSPLISTNNPGYYAFIPIFNPALFGLVNVPYDGNYNYISAITSAWNSFNPSIMLTAHISSLVTQDIWLGYGDNNFFFSNRLNEAYAQEPDTLSFSAALHNAGIMHTTEMFKNSEWSPGFTLPATGGSVGLKNQIQFHARVFESMN